MLHSTDTVQVLKMKEDRDGRVFVQGLKRIAITSPEVRAVHSTVCCL
jgi:hypothetical protein